MHRPPPAPTLTEPPSVPPPSNQAMRAAGLEQWITLAVLIVLVAGCYLVLQPFLSAVLWAIILCCTTWPVFNRLHHITRGR